jgi:uncharacterized protein (TIGR02145 family)
MIKMNKTFSIVFTLLFLAFLTNCAARKTTPTANALTTDTGVIINGITWATRNVDAPGTFAANPEDYGGYFQWNRKTEIWAYNRRGNISASGARAWQRANNPCPQGWRVPTQAELNRLAETGHVWTTKNGVNGYLFGRAPNQIFLPAAGTRLPDNTIDGADIWGFYWSSTRSNATDAWGLVFRQGSTFVISGSRAISQSVRCVKIN